MVKHIVMWKLKDTAEGADKKENAVKIKRLIEALQTKMDHIKTLEVGINQRLSEQGYDVVVLKRGGENQPGPEVLDAPGHVGLFAATTCKRDKVYMLSGNQNNAVTIAPYPAERILGIRRIDEN